MLLLLIANGLGQPLGERERQCNGMLRHYRSMYIARVGHDDIGGAQFRRHELMDCGSRRMNPPQLLCRLDLLAAQRPRDRDVGIGDFLEHMIVVGQMHHFELREVATQPLREPRRHLPQFEAVMKSDEEFHGDSVKFLVSSCNSG